MYGVSNGCMCDFVCNGGRERYFIKLCFDVIFLIHRAIFRTLFSRYKIQLLSSERWL